MRSCALRALRGAGDRLPHVRRHPSGQTSGRQAQQPVYPASDTRSATRSISFCWSISSKQLRCQPLRPTHSRAVTRPECSQSPATPTGGDESRRRPRKSPPRRSAPAPTGGLLQTLSQTVGIPSGRLPPSGLGIVTRLTGEGRQGPSRRAHCNSPSIRSTPDSSTAANVIASSAGRTLFAGTRLHASRDATPPDPVTQSVETAFRGPLGTCP